MCAPSSLLVPRCEDDIHLCLGMFMGLEVTEDANPGVADFGAVRVYSAGFCSFSFHLSPIFRFSV